MRYVGHFLPNLSPRNHPIWSHWLAVSIKGKIFFQPWQVSFGSVLTGSDMPDGIRLALLDVFGRLKQRVLWKWETETMADKPANVMLSKWLPQQDILGHPKLRLFVSHGGQSSCQESLCHQKPMVSVFNLFYGLAKISFQDRMRVHK